MADNRQFGSPKAPQFGDRISPGGGSGESRHCTDCESMLTDALDGTLSAADQETFDAHMAHCGPCGQMLADARRGAAWLEMLRDPRPEPPAALLERILAQTSGAQASGIQTQASLASGLHVVPAPVAGSSTNPAFPVAPLLATGNLLPFRSRFAHAVRGNALGQLMLQPRLAMTAAMAFFSIALTLDLTGVRIQDFRASDLRPTSIKRSFYSANARVAQYYEGLRVVYELESRVHELQGVSTGDTPAAGTQSKPQTTPDPATQPDQSDPKKTQPERRKSAPSPGTSRREGLGTDSLQLVAIQTKHTATEGRRA